MIPRRAHIIPHAFNGRTYFFTPEAADFARRLMRAKYGVAKAVTEPDREHARKMAHHEAAALREATRAPHDWSEYRTSTLARSFVRRHLNMTTRVMPGDMVRTRSGREGVVRAVQGHIAKVKVFGLDAPAWRTTAGTISSSCTTRRARTTATVRRTTSTCDHPGGARTGRPCPVTE